MPHRCRPTTIARLTGLTKVVALSFAIVCAVVQRTYAFSPSYSLSKHVVYFTIPTLDVAAAIALMLALVLTKDELVLRSSPGG